LLIVCCQDSRARKFLFSRKAERKDLLAIFRSIIEYFMYEFIIMNILAQVQHREYIIVILFVLDADIRMV